MSVPVPAAEPGPQQPKRRGRQTAVDMVISLVLILGVVGVVLLLAPQPGAVEQPQVDDAQAVSAVTGAVEALDAAPLLLVAGPSAALEPADVAGASDVVALDEGWRLDYARTESTDDVVTWRVGVLSPGQRRVDLEQAVSPTEDWLTRADEGRVEAPEQVQVGGLDWSRQVRGDGDTAYVHVGPAAGGLTTAVSGTSDSDDLRVVVEAVAASLAAGQA